MEEQSARLQGQFACLSDSKPKTDTPFSMNNWLVRAAKPCKPNYSLYNAYFLVGKGVGLTVSDLYHLHNKTKTQKNC